MEEFHKAPVKFYPQLATRNRAKLHAYIGNGIRRFPANILALLALIAAVVGAWNTAPALAASFISVPVLALIFIYAARILALLVAALFWLLSLYIFGRPRKARESERDLAVVFGVAKTLNSLFYRCPFLVACRPVKGTAAKEYIFWSRWQNLERWNRPEIKQAVLWALNVHSEEDFAPGDKPYTVKIRAVSGAIPKERETPQDPLF